MTAILRAAILLAGLFPFAVAPVAAQQEPPLRLTGALAQGGLVIGWTRPRSTVTLDGEEVGQNARGWFALGFARNQAPTAVLKVTDAAGRTLSRVLRIRQRRYRTQRIDGLPKSQVDPDSSLYKRLEREYLMVKKARETRTAAAYFRQGLVWPLKGRITGVYGSQRILNGKPQRPHYGVDIAAPRGTPVRATAAGTVVLAYDQMHFSGRTVMIDHGLGVNSVYIHLSKILVREGQKVDQGDVIGRIGTSGRSTGPHLHWGLHLHQRPLDPALAVKSSGVRLETRVQSRSRPSPAHRQPQPQPQPRTRPGAR